MTRSLGSFFLAFLFLVFLVNAVQAQSTEDRVRIDFQGLSAFTPAEVLKKFGEQGLQILRETNPPQNTVDEAAKALKSILAGRGYVNAGVVGIRVEGANQVWFVVDEGIQYSIMSLTFVGNKHFSNDELTARLRKSLAAFSGKATEYDQEVLEYGLRTVANHMRSLGYLQARLEDPQVRVAGAGLAISIQTTEGPLYRLGSLTVQGARAVSIDDIKSLLPMSEGDIVDGSKIGEWLFEDLKQVYGEKGFIEYTAEPIPHFSDNPRNPEEGIVDFDVQIEEGKRFTLKALTTEGEALSAKQQAAFFALRVGDYFNQRLFDESVTRINESGLFEPVDAYKNFKLATDQKNATVAVIVSLKKRSVLTPNHH